MCRLFGKTKTRDPSYIETGIQVSMHDFCYVFRSTSQSRPNKVGLKCPSVRPSIRPSKKSFFDFNDISYVGRGRRVMHDGMEYDPIQGQGQGHELLIVGNLAIFKGCFLPCL